MSIPNTKQFRDTQYHVSECGKVFNKHNKQKSPFNDGMNYQRVQLSVNGKGKHHYVHRMVAEVYHGIPSCPNTVVVNHIDGDPTNNHITNLEWVTQKDNVAHAVELGLTNKGKKRSRKVRCPEGNIYDSMAAAARAMNVHRRTITCWVNKPNHDWTLA